MKPPETSTGTKYIADPKARLHDEIVALAYQFYVENGRQDGHDLDDWLRAEKLVLSRRNEGSTQHARVSNVQTPLSTAAHVRPIDRRESPFARDERGSPTREEIRQRTSSFRPAARQGQG